MLWYGAVRFSVCPSISLRSNPRGVLLPAGEKKGMDIKSLLRTAAAMAAQVDEKEQAELVEELEEIIAQLKEKEKP